VAQLDMERRVLTVRDVALYLGVHPSTVYRLLQRGELPAFKVGSDWRFNRESIDRWRWKQEQALAQKISDQPASSQRLADELLHIVYWYQTEGLNDSVTANDIRLFVDHQGSALTRKLNRLVKAALLAEDNAGGDTRYHLTPQGLSQARQLLAKRPVTTTGHASVVEYQLRREEQCAASFEEKSFGPNSRTEVRS